MTEHDQEFTTDRPKQAYPTYRWFGKGNHLDLVTTPEDDEADRQWVEAARLANTALAASEVTVVEETEPEREPFEEGSSLEELVHDLVDEYSRVNAEQLDQGSKPKISLERLLTRLISQRKIPGSISEDVAAQARQQLVLHPPVAPESGLASWAQNLDDPQDARSRQFKD